MILVTTMTVLKFVEYFYDKIALIPSEMASKQH